jgi:predicted ATPase
LFSLPLEPEHCYRYNHGEPWFEPAGKLPLGGLREPLKADQSVLSQRKDPERFPQITYLGNQYASMRLYRDWSLGRDAPAREAQKTDLPVDFLEESCRNLGLVLNDFQQRPSLWDRVREELKRFCEPIEDVTLKIYGGTVQVLVHEAGLKEPIPATRLSDGTLRYLCLLSILLHPSPPPLICIEEPELGLHPDILPPLADLLVEASHRTQLIVTTHSETLVDALTSTPEAVVVCEKMSGSTVMQRLDSASLAKWLDEYTLGRLWRSGEIGGNRW